MSRSFDWMTAAIATVILLAGCSGPESNDGPPVPEKVTFSGQLDENFVGDWKSADGRSELDIAKSGSVTIKNTVASPQGDHRTSLSGSWLVSDGSLLLSYTVTGQPATVLKYRTKLENGTLTLAQGSGRLKTVYTRK